MKNIAQNPMTGNIVIANENNTVHDIVNVLRVITFDYAEYIKIADEEKLLKGYIESVLLFRIPTTIFKRRKDAFR